MRLPTFHMVQAFWVIVLFAGVQGGVLADTHYVVKNNAGASSPFTNWTTAASSIQQAIDDPLCIAGDVVLVTNGVYDTGGRTNAYAGNVLTNRVVITNAAIRVQAVSANPADTLIVGASNNGTNGPAAIRCVAMTKGTLTGFTLTNGHSLKTGGDSLGNDRQGGGMYALGASTIISNCVFVGNGSDGYATVTYGGGAIFTSSKFYDCTIAYNTCDIGGGGAAAGGTYTRCNIISNIAGLDGVGGRGGGLHRVSGVYDCVFIGNRAGTDGGGLWSEAFTMISNCVFRGNSATNYGGAVQQKTAATTILDTLFEGNRAGLDQSAISSVAGTTCINCEFRGHPDLTHSTVSGLSYMTNCLFVGNGKVFGDGINAVNTTIADNTGKVFNVGTSSLTNCIVYGNSSNLTGGLTYTIGYSCVNTAGVSTITVTGTIVTNNPMFVDSSSGNYRLQSGSPCVNSGFTLNWMTNAVDLDGGPRIRYGAVDMGCYEWLYKGAVFSFR